MRDHLFPERFVSVPVAEERGHRNQQIAEQGLGLLAAVPHPLIIVLQVIGPIDLHAPRDPPQHGGALVFGEVVSGAHTHMGENASQQFLVDLLRFGNGPVAPQCDQVGQAVRQRRYRQHEIGDAGGDRAARHRGVLGLVGILHQDDAGRLLHRAHAERAIGTGAAEDDGEAIVEMLGHRAKECVDGRALAVRLAELDRGYFVVLDLQRPVGRDHIDMVRLQLLALFHLHHRHGGAGGNDGGQFAADIRIEMDDDDKGGAGVPGQRAEERLQGLDTAGRGADGDDGRMAGVVPAAFFLIVVGHSAA